MAVNVVEILVKAKDMTKEGFAGANASSTTWADGIKKAGMIAAGTLAVVGYESVKMAATFDSAMTLLQTQAGVGRAKLDYLKTGVLQLASQVGFSPDSLAESLYHVASNMQSLGATGPQMLNAVRVAAEGAAVGHANLVDVTNALTAAIASGIPGVQNYSKAMGVLNATVGTGDMTMQNLAEAFGSGMVATVKGFGLSIQDVGAALATFGDNNIRGAHAGTQLRMSVMALAVPAKAGVAQLQAWGMSANQLATDMRSGGLMKALQDLHDHFIKAGITAKQQGDVITNMFGKKAGAGLNVLMDQLDRLKSKYPQLAAGADKFGTAWKKTQQTASQQFHELNAGFDSLMITIGQKLLPPLQKLMGWMLKNKTAVTDVLVGLLAFAAAVAVLAGVIKTVEIVSTAWSLAVKAVQGAISLASAATKIWTVVQAAFNLVMDANPIMLVVIAIAALVAGVILAYNHFAVFREFVHRVFTDVKNWIGDALNWVKAHWPLLLAILTGPIGLAVLFIRDHWAQITGFVGAVINWIKSHWPLLLAILTGPIGLAVLYIVNHWNQIVSGAVSMVHTLISWFTRLPGMILNAVGDLGHLLWNAGVSVVKGLIGGITSMFGAVGSVVGSLASKVAGFFGLSPAREGPLSAGGAPFIRGQHFAADFAAGVSSANPAVAGAMSRMAGLAGGMRAPAAGGGAAAGRGGVLTLRFEGGGGTQLEQDLWNWLKGRIRINGGGGPNSVQQALGQ